MFGNDKDAPKETDEMLRQLTNKLATSAHQLSEAARRLQLAELTYREYLSRLRRVDSQMRSLIELLRGPKENEEPVETNPAFCEPPPPKPTHRKLRYSDYIEFSNYAELKKFEKMEKITDGDVKSCDADELLRKLLEDEQPS